MNVAHEPTELAPARRAIAIGSFDGVHLGHRRVLDAARAEGRRFGVVTFDPHPRAVLGGGVELLATPERRLELLAEAGVDDVLVLRFDERLAALSAEEFAEDVLRAAGVEVVTAGETFRFGHGRGGDLALLERLGFEVRHVPIAEQISSSRIRTLLHEGDVRAAAQLLDRPAEIEGTVIRGDARGKALGFPTANLDVRPDLLVPPDGVYAGAARGRRAAISIGANPHFGGSERRVEAHLLDFDDDLYGQRLVVELWEYLRPQASFATEADLVATIAADVARTRAADRPS